MPKEGLGLSRASRARLNRLAAEKRAQQAYDFNKRLERQRKFWSKN